MIPGGRYVDRLIRYHGEWRIAGRTVLVDLSRNLGRPVPWSAPAAAAFTPARQDGQDVAQLALTEMARLRSSRRRDEENELNFPTSVLTNCSRQA